MSVAWIHNTPAVAPTPDRAISPVVSFFRWNETLGQHEMDDRIYRPELTEAEWHPVPVMIYDLFGTGEREMTIGSLISRLARAMQATDAVRENYINTQKTLDTTVTVIGEALLKEATDRGWCDDYDEFVREVNVSLPAGVCLPEREREYEVRWTETYTVTVDRCATYRAYNEDEAIDLAREEEEASRSEIEEAVRYGNYEGPDNYGAEYEVEEV